MRFDKSASTVLLVDSSEPGRRVRAAWGGRAHEVLFYRDGVGE